MTGKSTWMLYGAYGFSGKLILEEAIKRGHKPIVAGRNEKKVSELAERYSLNKVVLDIEDKQALHRALEDVPLIFNAAGPFIHTAEPIIKACLTVRTNYVDITGEIPVFRRIFSLHDEAMQKGICLLPGAGFDVVPTDCLASFLHQKLRDVKELELAFAGLSVTSPGTAKTMVEMLPSGGGVRRNGVIVSYPMGKGAKRIRFPHREYLAVPIPWGDLETAFRSTGIPNITTYMVFPGSFIRAMRLFSPAIKVFAGIKPLKATLQKIAGWLNRGPDENLRNTGRSYIYGMVRNDKGEKMEAWLETIEVYRFTAIAGVLCVEGVFENKPIGALTPSLAFGPDFVLRVEGTKRYESLP